MATSVVHGASRLDRMDTANLRIVTDTGQTRAKLTAFLARTPHQRYRGLSSFKTIADTRGMLFVYPEEALRTFVMREMAFPLDILFFSSDGILSSVYHARRTDDTPSEKYRDRARWVLEVNYNWTKRHGIRTGDRLVLENSPGPHDK